MSQRTSAAMAATEPRTTPEPLYGGKASRRVTVRDIAAAKARGEKWPMLTAYDALTAHIFDEAGIPVLLVGDSAGMVVFGHDTTIPVTVDDLIPLTAAVVRGTSRAMVVAEYDHARRVADQQHRDARFVEDVGGECVVGGEHGPLLTAGLGGGDVADGHPPAGLASVQGFWGRLAGPLSGSGHA